MNTVPLEFDISTTDAECAIGVKVILDGATLYDNTHLTGTHHFKHDISDEDGEHELSIEMYGKLPEHTKVTDAGEITQDALITVDNIQLDGIDINQLTTPAGHG